MHFFADWQNLYLKIKIEVRFKLTMKYHSTVVTVDMNLGPCCRFKKVKSLCEFIRHTRDGFTINCVNKMCMKLKSKPFELLIVPETVTKKKEISARAFIPSVVGHFNVK